MSSNLGRHIPRLRARDGDDCALCGKPIDFAREPGTWLGPSVDHKVPRAAGGHSNLANLQLAHAYPCNQRKGARHEGTDYGKLSDPYQAVEQLQAAAARRAQRQERIRFDSWSAARPH